MDRIQATDFLTQLKKEMARVQLVFDQKRVHKYGIETMEILMIKRSLIKADYALQKNLSGLKFIAYHDLCSIRDDDEKG